MTQWQASAILAAQKAEAGGQLSWAQEESLGNIVAPSLKTRQQQHQKEDKFYLFWRKTDAARK